MTIYKIPCNWGKASNIPNMNAFRSLKKPYKFLQLNLSRPGLFERAALLSLLLCPLSWYSLISIQAVVKSPRIRERLYLLTRSGHGGRWSCARWFRVLGPTSKFVRGSVFGEKRACIAQGPMQFLWNVVFFCMCFKNIVRKIPCCVAIGTRKQCEERTPIFFEYM